MQENPAGGPRSRLASLLLGLALLGMVGGIAGFVVWRGGSYNGLEIDPPRMAPDIPALDDDGERFSLSKLRGKLVVVSFGYTSCPDVCPLTLSRLKKLKAALGPEAESVEVAFVTVDPDRDTPERLATYVNGFDPSFHGLFIQGQELLAVMATWNVTVARRDAAAMRGDRAVGSRYYSVDHTSGIFVVDRRGKLRLRFPYDAEVEPMVQDLRRLLKEAGV